MTRRLYVPLSVGTHIDDRINDAGDAAELLWYRILQVVKTNESDGIIGHAQAVKLHSAKAVAALVRVGLLRPIEGIDTRRYRCAGWHDWNLSAAQIAVRRDADKARKAEQKATESPPIPDGNPPESERNPNGIQTGSATVPAGLLAEAVAEGPDEVDLVLQPPGVPAGRGSGTVNGFSQTMHQLGQRP